MVKGFANAEMYSRKSNISRAGFMPYVSFVFRERGTPHVVVMDLHAVPCEKARENDELVKG